MSGKALKVSFSFPSFYNRGTPGARANSSERFLCSTPSLERSKSSHRLSSLLRPSTPSPSTSHPPTRLRQVSSGTRIISIDLPLRRRRMGRTFKLLSPLQAVFWLTAFLFFLAKQHHLPRSHLDRFLPCRSHQDSSHPKSSRRRCCSSSSDVDELEIRIVDVWGRP